MSPLTQRNDVSRIRHFDGEGTTVNLERILARLKNERRRIDKAISALEKVRSAESSGKGKELPSRGSHVPEIRADLTVGTTRSTHKDAIPERKPGSSPFHPQPDE